MMKFSRYLLFTILAIAVFSCTKLPDGQVKVDGGIIQGVVTKDVTIYKGIPFAAPPVGDLRWKAPQPVVPWEGVKQTTEYAPAAISREIGVGKSEDCLYLNVWTPAKSANEKLPVLVWIYGGDSVGSTSVHPRWQRSRVRVVLVSIAYRVGQLGFWHIPS